MAKAESLGVILTLTLAEAQLLKAMTGKQSWAQADAIMPDAGGEANSAIYEALNNADVGSLGGGY